MTPLDYWLADHRGAADLVGHPVRVQGMVGTRDEAALEALAAELAVNRRALAAILACRAMHPAWSGAQIGAALDIRETVVERVLARVLPSDLGPIRVVKLIKYKYC